MPTMAATGTTKLHTNRGTFTSQRSRSKKKAKITRDPLRKSRKRSSTEMITTSTTTGKNRASRTRSRGLNTYTFPKEASRRKRANPSTSRKSKSRRTSPSTSRKSKSKRRKRPRRRKSSPKRSKRKLELAHPSEPSEKFPDTYDHFQ